MTRREHRARAASLAALTPVLCILSVVIARGDGRALGLSASFYGGLLLGMALVLLTAAIAIHYRRG